MSLDLTGLSIAGFSILIAAGGCSGAPLANANANGPIEIEASADVLAG